MEHKPTLYYAIQYFDDTGVMRAPYTICKGFVKAGWDVKILTAANDKNTHVDMAWDRVPVIKVGNGEKTNGLFQLFLRLLLLPKMCMTISWVWDWHCFSLLAARVLFGRPYVIVLDTYTHLAPWEASTIPHKVLP